MSASLPDRLAEACITSAARRWPAEISESMAYEWRSELAVLRAERGYGRSWRALRFAGSLALSPSVEVEGQSMGWRGHAPRLGRALLACLGLLGIATLADMLFGFTEQTSTYAPTWNAASGIVNDAALVIAVVVMALVGTAASRIGLIGRSDRSPYAAALAITAPIGIAAYAVLSPVPNGIPMHRLDLVVMLVTWTLLSTLATGRAIRAARAGRRGLAWAIAVAGGLVALDVASIAGGLRTAIEFHVGFAYAPAWFPLSVLCRQVGLSVTFGDTSWLDTHKIDGTYWGATPSALQLYGLCPLTGPLLLCASFVAGYALRTARAVRPATAAVSAEPLPARRTRITTALGAGGVVVGLCTWALVAGTQLGTPASSGAYSLFGELVQLRLGAISLVVVAAVVLLSGRGPVALPAAGIFAVLFSADCIAARHRTHHFGSAVLLLIVGAACVAGAWWASGRLAGDGSTDESARRSLVGAAVAGAIAIPTYQGLRLSLFASEAEVWAHADHTVIPAGFTALGWAVAVALWLVAIGAALASRRRPMGRLGTVLYVGVPLVALACFISWSMSAGVWLAGERMMLGHYVNMTAALLIEAPLAVTALAAARWDRTGGARAAARWLLLGVGAALFTLPLVQVEIQQQLLAGVISDWEPRWNPVQSSDFYAVELVADQLLLAVALGILVARLARPRSAGAAAAEPNRSIVPAPSIA